MCESQNNNGESLAGKGKRGLEAFARNLGVRVDRDRFLSEDAFRDELLHRTLYVLRRSEDPSARLARPSIV